MSQTLIDQLEDIVGPSGLVRDAYDMQPYLEDWRGQRHGGAYCVVMPSSTQQVSDIVRLANRLDCPIFLLGGNTGLCYGAVPNESGHCIVLALGRMRQIRALDFASNSIVVDAGTVLESVHQAAAEVGRSFPMHLGSEGTAQIGGLIATNAGGTNALRYGTMRDLVYGLEFVLPTGEIISDLSPLRKNNTGYDLKHLLIGGEGTLGVVTAAALKLYPAIKSDAHAWLSFDDPQHAVDLLGHLQDRFDISIIAYELLSESQMRLVLKHVPRTRTPLAALPKWGVLIELGTPNAATDLKTELEEFLASHFEDCQIVDAVVAQSSAQIEEFWRVRHSVSEANKLEGMGMTHDIAVSVSNVPAYLEAAKNIVTEHFPQAFPVITCHLGDGNIHYIVMFSADVWEAIADKASVIADVQARVHDLAMAMGGTFSAEHGVGRKLSGELERLLNPAKYAVLKAIKAAIDPRNILNPGIMLRQAEASQPDAVAAQRVREA